MGLESQGRVEAMIETLERALPVDLFATVQGLRQPDRLLKRQGYGLTWCSSAHEFVERFPHLPQSEDEQYPDEIDCIDLVVDIDPTGSVERIFLEALTLGETLDELGEERFFPPVIGLDAEDAAPILAAQLEAIFRHR